MPVVIYTKISVAEQTVKRLKRHAEPLDDTYDSVINRLLDAAEGGGKGVAPTNGKAEAGSLDPFAPPSLTHTKVLSARLNGEALKAPSWNGLLDEAVRFAYGRLGHFDGVRRIALMNIVNGVKSDEGYHFLPGIGISVQGQDANDAWRCAVHIAGHLRCPVEVNFVWRNKEGAVHPGESGVLRFDGVR